MPARVRSANSLHQNDESVLPEDLAAVWPGLAFACDIDEGNWGAALVTVGGPPTGIRLARQRVGGSPAGR